MAVTEDGSTPALTQAPSRGRLIKLLPWPQSAAGLGTPFWTTVAVLGQVRAVTKSGILAVDLVHVRRKGRKLVYYFKQTGLGLVL